MMDTTRVNDARLIPNAECCVFNLYSTNTSINITHNILAGHLLPKFGRIHRLEQYKVRYVEVGNEIE